MQAVSNSVSQGILDCAIGEATGPLRGVRIEYPSGGDRPAASSERTDVEGSYVWRLMANRNPSTTRRASKPPTYTTLVGQERALAVDCF